MSEQEHIIYLLENYNLEELELESDIIADGRKEITYKRMNSDEGGRIALDWPYELEIKRLRKWIEEAVDVWANCNHEDRAEWFSHFCEVVGRGWDE